jgi:hypothetical protein
LFQCQDADQLHPPVFHIASEDRKSLRWFRAAKETYKTQRIR